MKLDEKLNKDIKQMSKDGNIQKAIELCQIGLQNDPTNADLHIKLGDLYLKWHLDIYNSGQYVDEAITEYQRALETYMDSAQIYFKIGQAHYHKGDIDKSINYLKTAISKDPKIAKAYYLLAEAYTKRTRFLDAISSAKKSVKLKPLSNSCAHFILYNLYRINSRKSFKNTLRSRFELLLSILTLPFDKQALKNVKKSISYLKFFPILMKGYAQVNSQGLENSIEIYQEAIEIAPGFIPLYCLLGDIYRTLGQHEDAITEYKMAIWLDSLNIQAYRHLAQAYEEQGDYDNAIEVYHKLIQIMPTMPEFHSNLANIYYLKGDAKEAISHYQNAISLNPSRQWTSIISQTLGFVYQESKKDLDAAISAYQSAYLLTPEDIDIYINLGSAFYDKEDFENALTIYRSALELEPENDRIHCNLGFLYWGKGDLEEAIKEYNLAIKYNPAYDIAYNNLGVIYLDDLGHVVKSIDMFKKSIENNPNYALAHFNLARAISITGDKIEAAKLYQIAQDVNRLTGEMDPNDIETKLNDLFK